MCFDHYCENCVFLWAMGLPIRSGFEEVWDALAVIDLGCKKKGLSSRALQCCFMKMFIQLLRD
jgi:hypothetical protein